MTYNNIMNNSINNKIFSLKSFTNDNIFYNAKLYYKNYNSKIINWYNIFYYYFIIINDKIYINDHEFTHVYNFLLNDINHNHLEQKGVFNYNDYEKIHIDKCIFIKNLYTNAGHSFCNIINSIKKSLETIENIDEFKIIVTTELKNYNIFLFSVLLLFYKIENIIIIKENQLVSTNILFMEPVYSRKKKETVIFLQSNLKLYHVKSEKYKKIFLIKNNYTQNCTDGSFENDYNVYFESFGFIFIKCENYNIIELYNILNNAEFIIMSWGCCSYLNSMLIDNNISNVLVICNIKYKNEYEQFKNKEIYTDWFPFNCKNKYFCGDLTDYLDDNMKTILDKKMSEFCCK